MTEGTRMDRRRAQRRRSTRILAIAIAVIAVGTILWLYVFPWVDRTFVNRPEIGV